MFKSCLSVAVTVLGCAFAAPTSAEARVGVFVGPRGGVAVTAGRPHSYSHLAYNTAVYPVYSTSYVYPTSAYLYSTYPTTYVYPVTSSRSVLITPKGGAVYGRYGVMGWR
jgi:hypothetical protein